jgi:hypothetical protein
MATPEQPRAKGAPPRVPELHQAAAAGDLATLERLCDAGADLDKRDAKGRTALFHAVSAVQLAALEFLIRRGARFQEAEGYPHNPLHEAIARGSVEAVQALIAAGAYTDATNRHHEPAWCMALERRSDAVAGAVLRATDDETLRLREPLLTELLQRRRRAILDEVLARRAYTQAGLERALVWAAGNGNLDALLVLLGASPSQLALNNALLAASKRGDLDAVNTLLKASADPQATDADYNRPLHLALRGGHDAVARTLEPTYEFSPEPPATREPLPESLRAALQKSPPESWSLRPGLGSQLLGLFRCVSIESGWTLELEGSACPEEAFHQILRQLRGVSIESGGTLELEGTARPRKAVRDERPQVYVRSHPESGAPIGFQLSRDPGVRVHLTFERSPRGVLEFALLDLLLHQAGRSGHYRMASQPLLLDVAEVVYRVEEALGPPPTPLPVEECPDPELQRQLRRLTRRRAAVEREQLSWRAQTHAERAAVLAEARAVDVMPWGEFGRSCGRARYLTWCQSGLLETVVHVRSPNIIDGYTHNLLIQHADRRV